MKKLSRLPLKSSGFRAAFITILLAACNSNPASEPSEPSNEANLQMEPAPIAPTATVDVPQANNKPTSADLAKHADNFVRGICHQKTGTTKAKCLEGYRERIREQGTAIDAWQDERDAERRERRRKEDEEEGL